MKENKKIDWLAIILGILTILGIIFGVATTVSLNKEKEERIRAQNKIAEQSTIIQEKDGRWSRLSQQLDNINDILSQKDEEFAKQLQENNENILALSETVVRIKGTKIIIREENIREIPIDDRIRVEFDESLDPIRVSGHTFTNPPEAEIDVDFTRPLRLRTTVVQNEDRSWKTYFEADWENIEIEDIKTIVSPIPNDLNNDKPKDRFVLGAQFLTSTKFDALNANTYLLYNWNSFSLGPAFGVSLFDGRARAMFGVNSQIRLGRGNR